MSGAEENVERFITGNGDNLEVLTPGVNRKTSAMSLEELMDGPIRDKLGIIPDDVRFAGETVKINL